MPQGRQAKVVLPIGTNFGHVRKMERQGPCMRIEATIRRSAYDITDAVAAIKISTKPMAAVLHNVIVSAQLKVDESSL
jgi:hypothetical protein